MVTNAGQSRETLDVQARFDDVGTVLAIPEDLQMQDGSGEAYEVAGTSPLLPDGPNAIIVPDISQLSDGQYFVLSDGTNSLRFEFDVNGDGVAIGAVPVEVDPAVDSSENVAQYIADAINNLAADGYLPLNIVASAAGDEVQLTPGSGRASASTALRPSRRIWAAA